VQERTGNTLKAFGLGKDFLSSSEVVQKLRERIDKWDYMKLKIFCTTKDMISKLKRPPTEWEKNIFQLYIRQGTDNQTIQGAQKPILPKSQ
jgi:mitochondrial fission protein ELM1